MHVLITGAAGVLGRGLTALLEREPGVVLRLTDVIPMPETEHEFLWADLIRHDQVRRLCDGIDVVCHVAAIHPWRTYTGENYVDCNIRGTYSLFNTAAAAGVRRVIYTSSIAAMGMAREPSVPLPWDETKPCVPDDIYGLSKLVGEQFCQQFARQGKFEYIALRPGTFIPRPPDDPRYGIGLLSANVHHSDVAQAHLLAVRAEGVRNEAIVITSKAPFVAADGPALLTDAAPVIRRYFPAAAGLAARGVELPQTLDRCYDIGKAERLLGYRPSHTFGSWLSEMGVSG